MINTLSQGGNSQNGLTCINEHRTAFIPTPVDENQETALIACLWSAQQSLASAKTIGDAEKIRQNIKALEALSKEFKLSKEIQVDATELRIRAERRLGEMLKVMEKAKPVGNGSNQYKKSNQSTEFTDCSFTPTLADMGISKYESSKFQRLASVDEPSFETAVTNLKEQAIAGRQSALSTAGVIKVTREESRGDKEPEFSPLIKPSDNWNFGSIKYGRIDESMDEDWGYIPGEIYANCFWYYVKPGDLVVAPMAGAGQCRRVYVARQEWMGTHTYDFDLKMFDLSPRGRYKDLIGQHNVIESFPVKNPDYIVMDVPYYGMATNQYSDKPEDLANMTLSDWQIALGTIAKNCAEAQQPGALCTVISPNYRDVAKGTIVMVTDTIGLLWKSAGYTLYDKAYSSRRIQQNQNPNMARMNNQAKANRIMLTDITEILTFQKSRPFI